MHLAVCPLWVISRHLRRNKSCPLYPQSGNWMAALACTLWAKSGHRPNSAGETDKGFAEQHYSKQDD